MVTSIEVLYNEIGTHALDRHAGDLLAEPYAPEGCAQAHQTDDPGRPRRSI